MHLIVPQEYVDSFGIVRSVVLYIFQFGLGSLLLGPKHLWLFSNGYNHKHNNRHNHNHHNDNDHDNNNYDIDSAASKASKAASRYKY